MWASSLKTEFLLEDGYYDWLGVLFAGNRVWVYLPNVGSQGAGWFSSRDDLGRPTSVSLVQGLEPMALV